MDEQATPAEETPTVETTSPESVETTQLTHQERATTLTIEERVAALEAAVFPQLEVPANAPVESTPETEPQGDSGSDVGSTSEAPAEGKAESAQA